MLAQIGRRPCAVCVGGDQDGDLTLDVTWTSAHKCFHNGSVCSLETLNWSGRMVNGRRDHWNDGCEVNEARMIDAA
jgi:hypothetical protein